MTSLSDLYLWSGIFVLQGSEYIVLLWKQLDEGGGLIYMLYCMLLYESVCGCEIWETARA